MGLCKNDSLGQYCREKLGKEWGKQEREEGKSGRFQVERQCQPEQQLWSGNYPVEFVLKEAVIGCRSPVGRGGV